MTTVSTRNHPLHRRNSWTAAMKSVSPVLVLVFVLGTVLVEAATGHQLKQRENKLKMSRRNYGGRYEKTTNNSDDASFEGNPFEVSEMFAQNLDYGEKDLVNFNYETLWRNGSSTLTLIPFSDGGFSNDEHLSQLDHMVEKTPIDNSENLSFVVNSEFNNSFWSFFHSQNTKRRLKRIIFGRDGRIKLDASSQAQKFPFSSTVKISTGCSGSAISHKHVLTSAHCVHNGTGPIVPVADLKVGFLRRNGKLHWTTVDSIHFPEIWRLQNNSPHFDYAVITLHKPHKRPFIKLSVIKNKAYLYKLHFASFPGDKNSNAMWYSHCFSRVISHLLIGRCDASSGSSGAGTYIRTSNREIRKSRVLVGILSGYGRIRLPSGRLKMFNLVTKLTKLKVSQICRWIGAGANCSPGSSKSPTNKPRKQN